MLERSTVDGGAVDKRGLGIMLRERQQSRETRFGFESSFFFWLVGFFVNEQTNSSFVFNRRLLVVG